MLRMGIIVFLLPMCAVGGVTLPDEYAEVTLNATSPGQVVETFGDAERQVIPFGHHEEGYCYTSANGISAVFAIAAEQGETEVSRISIHQDKPRMSCLKTERQLSDCIGGYCLGQTKAQIEERLGSLKLEITNDGSGSYVAGVSKTRGLTEQEKRKLPEAISEIDVTHNLWVKFAQGKVAEVGTVRFETF